MGYCAVSDVEMDFKNITFSSSYLITDTAVQGFIDEFSAMIDSYVGNRWVTPVTADASSLSLMKLYCRTLTADRIRGILANKQQTNTDANQQVKSDGFSAKNAMDALKALAAGTQVLSGGTLLLANAGFFSNNNANGVTPKFQKNLRQW